MKPNHHPTLDRLGLANSYWPTLTGSGTVCRSSLWSHRGESYTCRYSAGHDLVVPLNMRGNRYTPPKRAGAPWKSVTVPGEDKEGPAPHARSRALRPSRSRLPSFSSVGGKVAALTRLAPEDGHRNSRPLAPSAARSRTM